MDKEKIHQIPEAYAEHVALALAEMEVQKRIATSFAQAAAKQLGIANWALSRDGRSLIEKE